MNRILVGFDGSDGAEKALNKAMLIIDEDGELILLAVVPTPSEKKFVDVEIYEKLKEKAHNIIDNTVNDIGSHSFDVRGIVEEGDVAAKIIDVANNLKCDLIILGSVGSEEFGKYPIGSVANKVVQYAGKPVMVVR